MKGVAELRYDKKTGRGGCLEEGFSNDIDNGISLWPNHITEKGEFVFLVNPASLYEAELKALGLKEDDNPMLVVGKWNNLSLARCLT